MNPKKYVVFVEDRRFVRTSCSTVSLQSLSLCLYSSNGTFVGGEKIGELAHTLHTHREQCPISGKNKTRVLNSDDEISLALKTNKGL